MCRTRHRYWVQLMIYLRFRVCGAQSVGNASIKMIAEGVGGGVLVQRIF